MSMHFSSRRRFLQQSLAAGAATAFSIRTGSAAPAGEKVNMAFIGIGQRAEEITRSFLKTGLVNPVAFCDVDVEQGPKLRKQHPNVPCFQDFRKMFDKLGNEIDAVCVGTPDHTHFPICMAAAALGKHFYVEKPLTHTFEECELLMAAERKYKVHAQMGNQGHSGDNFYQFKAWTEAGIIKDVTRVDAFMNSPRRWHPWKFDGFQTGEKQPAGIDWDLWTGPAAMHPFSKYLHPGNWRSWFAYGNGAFGDWGPHILDTCHRFLKLGLPTEIEAVNLDGRRKEIFPMASTIRFAFPARGNMPPCEVIWRDGVDNPPPVPEGFDAKKLPKNGKFIHSKDLVFAGETHEATLKIVSKEKAEELKGKLPDYRSKETRNHFMNFVLACKGEMECKSTMAVAAPLTQVFLLGVIAQHLGGKLAFDPATRRFTNNDEANALLNPPPRAGWESYYKL
ncbi:MAG: Gfo/Idh/MocA family oxidoreductase [Akkermansiaceae bacterium]|nr:Gfo/Idh/MocA family oxidoreductase [Akkermansiaceae bacterium]